MLSAGHEAGAHANGYSAAKPVSTDQLNLGKPRVCPACLREQSVWWAVWDLVFGSCLSRSSLPSP